MFNEWLSVQLFIESVQRKTQSIQQMNELAIKQGGPLLMFKNPVYLRQFHNYLKSLYCIGEAERLDYEID